MKELAGHISRIKVNVDHKDFKVQLRLFTEYTTPVTQHIEKLR